MKHMGTMEKATIMYRAGSILVWSIGSEAGDIDVVASEMAALAEAHTLGAWSATPYGLNLNRFFFDLVLGRDVSAFEIKLIFQSSPAVY